MLVALAAGGKARGTVLRYVTAAWHSTHAAATDPAGHCVQGAQCPLLFSLKPASQSHVQPVLEKFPFVTQDALAGLPWQLAHTLSVSEHGDAV